MSELTVQASKLAALPSGAAPETAVIVDTYALSVSNRGRALWYR